MRTLIVCLAASLALPALALVQSLGSEAMGALRAAGYEVGEARCEGDRCRMTVDGTMRLVSDDERDAVTLQPGRATSEVHAEACAAILSAVAGLTDEAARQVVLANLTQAMDDAERVAATYGPVRFVAVPRDKIALCRFVRGPSPS